MELEFSPRCWRQYQRLTAAEQRQVDARLQLLAQVFAGLSLIRSTLITPATVSIFESRRHNWADCPPDIEVLELVSVISRLPK